MRNRQAVAARAVIGMLFLGGMAIGGLLAPWLLAAPPGNAPPTPGAPAAAIPNDWSFAKDGLDRLPLLDFTPPKPAAAPAEDPKADEQARKLYSEVQHRSDEKKWAEARKALDALLAGPDRHGLASQAFQHYVMRISEDKTRKDEALAACREMLKRFPQNAWNAFHAIQQLTGTQLYFYSGGSTSVEPGQKSTLHVNGRNLKKIKLAAYKVDLFRMVEQGISPQAPSVPPGVAPVKSWTHDVKQRDRENGWFNETIEVPLSEPGAYVLTLGADDYTWTTLAIVSRLAVATKGDGRILIAYAGDVRGGKAPGPCEIAVLDGARAVHRGTTNADGLFAGRVQGHAQNGLVVLRRGEDWAVSHAQSYGGGGYHAQIYAYTDRPVYRPKQTVHFKCIVRHYNLQKDAYEFNPGADVHVSIHDPKWNEVFKKTVKTNDYGTAEFSMVLGDEPPLGYYHVTLSGAGYGNTQFSVQEYKKPEYEVSVTPAEAAAVIGEPVKIAIGARYYFGEPVKGAEVSYEIYANPHYEYHYGWGGRYAHYYWFAEEHFAHRHPRAEGQLVASGQGRLDDKGRIEIAYDGAKLSKDAGHDYDLSIRASVTDKSRRQIQGYGAMRLGRTGLCLALHNDRYSYHPGDRVTIDVRTTTLAGEGVAASVRCAVRRRVKDAYERRFEQVVETNAQGHGALAFVPDENGDFQVEAEASDARGRKARQSISLWVADESWRSPHRYGGFAMKTDREIYQPGDKAQVILTTGHENHPVLVTADADRIERYKLARFGGGFLAIDQPVEKHFAPDTVVTALVFADGAFSQQQCVLVVPPADKWLTVSIAADKPQYKPGQDAVYTVGVADHRGEPVEAEVSFGLVDEALYAIQADQTPDIRKFYYGQRYRYIHTQTSFWFHAAGLGGAAPTEQAAGRPGIPSPVTAPPSARAEAKADMLEASGEAKAKDGRALVPPRLRKEFADAAVWRPQLRAVKDGKVAVPFTMPDNLTTWRAKVVAVTRDGRVGQQTHQVITRQNLMVRLECPRTFTERDEATVSAIVHNYLGSEKRCVVSLKNDGGTLAVGDRQVELRVPAGGDRRVDWRLRIDTHKTVKLSASALTDEESDAMELPVPVIPHGLRMLAAEAGAVDEIVRLALVLPKDAELRKAYLRVTLSPSLAAAMFDSLEYLADFPYGCVEQTMSRFLPSVVVARVLQQLGMRNAKLEENLPKYVTAGLGRLYDFQHDDGGWGWWKQDQTNPDMTAYVVYGLASAREADYGVSDHALNRGAEYLAQHIPKEKDLDTRAYMTFALSRVREPERGQVDALVAGREKLSDYAAALLLLTCQKTRRADHAKDLVRLLEARAAVTPVVCSWGGAGEQGYHWQRNAVQATAYAVKALVAADPKHPLLPKAVQWLVVQRRGTSWYSTKDTAAAIFGLADYMKASGELNPDYTATLALHGKAVQTFTMSGNALKLSPTAIGFGPDDVKHGENAIEIRKSGKGSLYYSCALEYYTTGEDLPPSGAGLKVSRAYTRLAPKATRDQIAFERQPLGREVNGGEEIEVRVVVEAEKPYDYFILEDFFPAGCEVVEDKSDLDQRYRHWWGYCSNRERRDAKMVFFASRLNHGTHTFVYTLRAEKPGEYHVMPAQASLMYQPDVRGTSAEERMTIFEGRGSTPARPEGKGSN